MIIVFSKTKNSCEDGSGKEYSMWIKTFFEKRLARQFFEKKRTKKDFNEINIMIQVIHLTEEEVLPIVDSNNAKLQYMEHLWEVIMNLFLKTFKVFSEQWISKIADSRFF